TEVVEAQSGEECVRRARESRPDVILLDVMMPFMDGPGTLEALRADPVTASIPVVFLTASVMPSEVDRLKRLGARAVIAKPFDPASLPARVREILGTAVAVAAPRLPSTAAEADGLGELRAQFVRRARERTGEA